MKNIHQKCLALVVLTMLAIPCLSFAEPCVLQETASDNIALARIYHILQSVKPLIIEAKSAQDKTARIQFQYQQLENDLVAIQTGIDAYFHPPCLQPRTIRPIIGDYVK